VPALCLGQADPVTSQKVLEELRGIRASLERIERSERALLALLRLQGDQAELAAIEAKQARSIAREAELARQIADGKRAVSAPAPLVRTAEGTTEPAPRADDEPLRARLAESEAALRETQARKRATEEEIARLRLRIAATEKLIDELLQM
jgi:hypothetical protein